MERLGNVRLRKYFASAPKLAAIINFEINRAWAGLQVVTKMALSKLSSFLLKHVLHLSPI